MQPRHTRQALARNLATPARCLCTHGDHRLKHCFAAQHLPSVQPNQPPSPAFSSAQSAAFRKPFWLHRWPPLRRRLSAGKPLAASTRAFVRLSTPATTAATLRRSPCPLQAASASTPCPPRALAFPAVATACTAPPRSKCSFARCARFDLERCLRFSPPAGRPDLPPAFRTFAFPRRLLCLRPTPPRPAFAHHDFRFHHHRPNDSVSGAASPSQALAGA